MLDFHFQHFVWYERFLGLSSAENAGLTRRVILIYVLGKNWQTCHFSASDFSNSVVNKEIACSDLATRYLDTYYIIAESKQTN